MRNACEKKMRLTKRPRMNLCGAKQFSELGRAIPVALEHGLPVDIGDDLLGQEVGREALLGLVKREGLLRLTSVSAKLGQNQLV